MSNPIKLTIKPADVNYDPERREFSTRAVAQSKVNELYGNGYIDRVEWSRLTDELSPKMPEAFDESKPEEELVGTS